MIGVRCRLSVRRPNVHSWPIRRSPRPHRSGRPRPEQPPPPRPPRRPLPCRPPLRLPLHVGAASGAAPGPRRGGARRDRGLRPAGRPGRAARRADGRGRPRARRRVWSTPAVRASSPTPARCSSRSPGCAATAATTAPSPPCRTACPRRSSSATRCWRSPAPAPPQGCKEALFTLGDRPEERWPAAREWLDGPRLRLHAGLRARLRDRGAGGDRPAAAPQPRRAELGRAQRLKPVAPSMGMMLETTATRLWSEPGGPHFGSPDKEPAVRLRVLTDAGRVGVPFTTGILIGIGETRVERAESLFAIRAAAREYGHVQEMIVQNFRAKPDTAMRERPGRRSGRPRRHDRGRPAGARAEDAAPGAAEPRRRRVRAAAPGRHRRLGRRLAGDAGPRQPGAPLAGDRRAGRAARPRPGSPCGSGSRSTRGTCCAGSPWIDPRLHAHVAALADPETGLARDGARPGGPPVAGAGRRVRLHRPRRPQRDASTPRAAPSTAAATSPRSTATGTRCASSSTPRGRGRPSGWTPTSAPGSRSRRPIRRPCSTRPTPTPRWPCCLAEGPALEELARAADELRRDVVGDDGHLRRQPQHQLHQRLLRGLPVLRLRPARARRRRVPAVAGRGRRAGRGGGRRRVPPRCACRAGSTRSCPSPSTRTWSGRCGPPSPACTCTRSRRWRS